MKKGGGEAGGKAEITHCPKPAAKTQRVFFSPGTCGEYLGRSRGSRTHLGATLHPGSLCYGQSKEDGDKGDRTKVLHPKTQGWALLQPLQWVLPRAFQIAVRGAESCPKNGVQQHVQGQAMGTPRWEPWKGTFLLSDGLCRR